MIKFVLSMALSVAPMFVLAQQDDPDANRKAAPPPDKFIEANTVTDAESDYGGPPVNALEIKLREGAEIDVEDMTEEEKVPRLELIVDSSGSMGQIMTNNKTKMFYLKKMMKRFFKDQWKEKAEVGLRVYGARRKGDCKDNQLMFDFSERNMSKVQTTVAGLFPIGRTPLFESVRLAVDDLASYDGPKRLIIFTDGEDTCGGDPCKMAEEMKKTGLDLKMFVVAIDFDPKSKAYQNVACLGETTAVANNEDEMYDAFSKALNSANKDRMNLVVVSPDPKSPVDLFMFKDGKWEFFKTFTASFGTTVPPGEYQAVVRLQPPFRFDRFVVPPKKKVTLTVSGYGQVFVKFLDKLLRVEVLDKNMKVVDKFRSDQPKRVREGKWRLRIFREPFFEKFVDPFVVVPGGVHNVDVTEAGAVRVVNRETKGLYVYGGKKEFLGNFVTNANFVMPLGSYRFYVDERCDLIESAVLPETFVQQHDCDDPKRKKSNLPAPENR